MAGVTQSDQITHRNIFRVLVAGFSVVIVLLVAAGAIGVNTARSIKETAAGLVREQLVTTRLMDEVEREQEVLNAAFYKLSRAPNPEDREHVLSQLDGADREIQRIVAEAKGSSQEQLWGDLSQATSGFSTEARRLLAGNDLSNYSSRDLFHRHEEVTMRVAQLISAGYQRALKTQTEIEHRSQTLVEESLLLLGACLAAALLGAVFTVRITSQLFRKMEWQAGELSRVSWYLLENQETTARRFSHELHDELGQALTAVKANLVALESETSGDKTRLEDCTHLVDEALRNVRELSQLLRPTILDDFGLDASLRWLGERFMQRTGIEVEYQSSFSGRLADETETHLFRIVQEALTNVARHSRATRVQIHLWQEGQRIRLMLGDNGRGIEKRDGEQAGGMGMIGMRARARSAGGELAIQTRPGDGVVVEAWAPLRSERDKIKQEGHDPHSVSR